jgi:hypothetical protein
MMAKVSRMCRFCSRVSEGLAEMGSDGGASSVKDMGATRGCLTSGQHDGEPLMKR